MEKIKQKNRKRNSSKMHYIIKMFGTIDSVNRAALALDQIGYEPWFYGEADGTITNVGIEFDSESKIDDIVFIYAASRTGINDLKISYTDKFNRTKDYGYIIEDLKIGI